MDNTADRIAEARRLQQAGYFSRAEEIYRQLLQANPDDGELWFLLGDNLFHQGRFDDAITHFRRSIALAPHAGGAYLNLSHVLRRQGKIEEAVTCLQQCLRRLPEFPEAHYNQGNNLASLGRLQEAVTHYREALRLKPDFPEVHNNLASTLLLLEKPDEAMPHLESAIQLRPDYTEAYCNLGNAYRDLSQFAEAVRSYERALELHPDYGPAHNALGEALLKQGDQDGAERHFRRALHNNPFMIRTLFNLANHGFYTAADPSIDTLKRWLTDPRLPVDFAIQLHFTLGKLLDRLGLWDEAFEHYARGNALRRDVFQKSGTAFNADAHASVVDEMMATCSDEYFRRVRGFGSESELPIFIVGMPRSGTTLVEQILSSHPEVFGAGELPDIGRLVASLPARLGSRFVRQRDTRQKEDSSLSPVSPSHLSLSADSLRYPECLSHLDATTARELAEAYLTKLTGLDGQARRVTDKMLELSLHLGLMATLFPRARVIYCRRDPRDTCLSCFFQYFKGLNFTWDLEDLGRYCRDRERLMTHWRSVLPLPILEVVYEELVSNQEAVSRRLIDFCGLEWHDSCLRFYENRRPVKTSSVLQVRQPIYGTSVERWRHYEPHLKPLLEALDSQASRT